MKNSKRPMKALTLCLSLCVCLGVPLLAAAKEPTWKQHPSKNKPRKHVMVQFTDSSLHPSIAQVLKGGTLSWVNYASMYRATIVFSDEVATAFTCSDLRPDWNKTGAGYMSVPITMGGPTDDLEIPCPLKPGEYEYEIWLYSGSMGQGFGIEDDPQDKMQGKILVE